MTSQTILLQTFLSPRVAPSAAEKAELHALVGAQQNPKSAQYHRWLTQEEFGARFGLTQADLTKVTGWLETQGFTVKKVAPSRNLITFSGTVAQAESAFRTRIHQYRIGADTRISNATEIALPRGLADVVAGHKTISMTARYSHLAPSSLHAAVESLLKKKGQKSPTDTTTDTSNPKTKRGVSK
jgi:subtilase family serine protease